VELLWIDGFLLKKVFQSADGIFFSGDSNNKAFARVTTCAGNLRCIIFEKIINNNLTSILLAQVGYK
jgi:hypothetical protein